MTNEFSITHSKRLTTVDNILIFHQNILVLNLLSKWVLSYYLFSLPLKCLTAYDMLLHLMSLNYIYRIYL